MVCLGNGKYGFTMVYLPVHGIVLIVFVASVSLDNRILVSNQRFGEVCQS